MMENICQSCGVPMNEEIKPGTNADGSTNNEYCCYCFADGSFDASVKTMDDMINLCVPHMVEGGVAPDADSAKAMLQATLPQLKRWKAA